MSKDKGSLWLIYRRYWSQKEIPKNKQLSLLKFVYQIASALISAGTVVNQVGRPPKRRSSKCTLRKKCPYSELFQSPFSLIRMQESPDQKNANCLESSFLLLISQYLPTFYVYCSFILNILGAPRKKRGHSNFKVDRIMNTVF